MAKLSAAVVFGVVLFLPGAANAHDSITVSYQVRGVPLHVTWGDESGFTVGPSARIPVIIGTVTIQYHRPISRSELRSLIGPTQLARIDKLIAQERQRYRTRPQTPARRYTPPAGRQVAPQTPARRYTPQTTWRIAPGTVQSLRRY